MGGLSLEEYDELIRSEMEFLSNEQDDEKRRLLIDNIRVLSQARDELAKQISIDKQMAIDKEKIALDKDKIEVDLKKIEHQTVLSKKENKLKVASIAATIATTVVGLLFYGSWYKKGFQFEETGRLTSETFKSIRRNSMPKDKKF